MIQKQIDEAISSNKIEFNVPVYLTDININPDIENHKDYQYFIKKSHQEFDKSKINLLYPIKVPKTFILYCTSVQQNTHHQHNILNKK